MERDTVYLLQRSTCCQMCSRALVNCHEGNTTLNSNLMLKYKWLKLPFGLKVSSDVFQERLHSVLQGVKGIIRCADDVLARSVESMDQDVNVLRLLETARMHGIKINPKKLHFKSTKCEFFGHTLMLEGMKIDDSNIEAIK